MTGSDTADDSTDDSADKLKQVLANFALDNVFLECQLHVTCEPVECQIESRTNEFCTLGGIQVGQVQLKSTLPQATRARPVYDY